ncbi:MAG: glycosyltransferase family 2 protein [Deltaproteobacteria bacterium]|nr:glycosyltransferase family 2 protein [Deltaproteobacteria bacterium]
MAQAEKRTRVLAVILAKDEETRVGDVVREVLEAGEELEARVDVVVVDDGSTDATAVAAREAGALVISHPVNLRIGAAEQTGVMHALAGGYDVAVRLDGDGQHPADGIGPLVSEVLDGGADMACGSRFVPHGKGYTSTPARRVGIAMLSALVSMVAGRRVSDPTSGFRAFGPRAMRLLTALPASDYPEPETIIDARRAGLTVREVPIAFRARTSGKSSIGPMRALYYMTKITLAVLVAGIRRSIEV